MSAPDTRRDFGLACVRLGRRWRSVVDAELGKFGLTAATWRPLFYLGEVPDGMRPKDLAEILDMERPSVVQLIDRLEKQGYVRRCEDPQDRRGKLLHLTDKGREIYRQTVAINTMVGSRLLSGISDDDIALCLRIIAQVHANAATLAAEANAAELAAEVAAP